MDTAKFSRLKELIYSYGRVAVAFSGGADSALLARVAYDMLGSGAIAVIAHSPIHAKREYTDAVRLSQFIGIKLLTVDTKELELPGFVSNPPDRCYHCKKHLLTQLKKAAKDAGYPILIEGSNADDAGGYRPGMKAVAELKVKSPLRELGITKQEIRSYSKLLGLPTWDRPSMTCLATRLPYGEPLTRSTLSKIESAEDYLAGRGFRYSRVRCHGNIARVELPPADRERIFQFDGEIASYFKALGFDYTTVDLLGYRGGSMDETLDLPIGKID